MKNPYLFAFRRSICKALGSWHFLKPHNNRNYQTKSIIVSTTAFIKAIVLKVLVVVKVSMVKMLFFFLFSESSLRSLNILSSSHSKYEIELENRKTWKN